MASVVSRAPSKYGSIEGPLALQKQPWNYSSFFPFFVGGENLDVFVLAFVISLESWKSIIIIDELEVDIKFSWKMFVSWKCVVSSQKLQVYHSLIALGRLFLIGLPWSFFKPLYCQTHTSIDKKTLDLHPPGALVAVGWQSFPPETSGRKCRKHGEVQGKASAMCPVARLGLEEVGMCFLGLEVGGGSCVWFAVWFVVFFGGGNVRGWDPFFLVLGENNSFSLLTGCNIFEGEKGTNNLQWVLKMFKHIEHWMVGHFCS